MHRENAGSLDHCDQPAKAADKDLAAIGRGELVNEFLDLVKDNIICPHSVFGICTRIGVVDDIGSYPHKRPNQRIQFAVLANGSIAFQIQA
jgi:hypothetical protein